MSATLPSISDFPDRISPMLVKELRQGLRTRSFIGVFLALHIILGLILLIAGAGAASDSAGSTISTFIFVLFSIAVLLIQPLRGIAALSSEIKSNTIDMMVLTRLSAWRIITGKWFAIVAQSALILITVIPYLILRYFFGGMNLFAEIILILLIFITSATLTAITVGLSATGSIILRSIVPIFGIPIGLLLLVGYIESRSSFIDTFSLNSSESQIILAIYVFSCLYISFFLLALGTALIAPYAENHSTLRRLVALVVTIITSIMASLYLTEIPLLAVAYILILTPIFASSLTEFTFFVPPTYSKFNRLGILGKISAPLLLPGWPSGLFFCLTLTLIASCPIFTSMIAFTSDNYVLLSSIFCTLIFPAFIINLFKLKGELRITNYILFMVASSILTAVLGGVASSMSNHDFLWIFSWLPSMPLYIATDTTNNDDAALSISIIFNLLYTSILLALAIPSYIKNITEVKNH